MENMGRKVTSVDLILLVVKIFPFNNIKKSTNMIKFCVHVLRNVCAKQKKNVSRKYFSYKREKGRSNIMCWICFGMLLLLLDYKCSISSTWKMFLNSLVNTIYYWIFLPKHTGTSYVDDWMNESIILAGNFTVLLMLLFKSFSFGSRRFK